MSQKQSIPKIKNGIFSELQLVNLYGTDKQKKSYCTNGRFIGGYKKEFLKKLSLYCDITDLGKRTYEIKLREEDLPFNIKKMNFSLYQYLVPLVLQYLLEGYSKNNILKTTFGKWAVDLKVINPNYNLVRYNLREASYLFSCEVDLLLDFFIRSDKIINYYFKKALDYLNDSGYIAITEKEKVLKEEIDDKAQIIKSSDGDSNTNDIFIYINYIDSLASKNDMELYFQLVKKADNAAHILYPYERYYSNTKAPIFKRVLKKELADNGILRVYKYYEIYYTSKIKCKNLLKNFSITNTTDCATLVSKEFNNKILKNAQKRYNETVNDNWGELSSIDVGFSKVKLYTDDYLSCYEKISNTIINPSYPDISDKINIKEKQNKDINKYNIQFVKNYISDSITQ